MPALEDYFWSGSERMQYSLIQGYFLYDSIEKDV